MSVNGHSEQTKKPEFRVWFADGRANVIQAVISDTEGNRDRRDAVIIAIPGEPGIMLALTPDEADEIADCLNEFAINIRIKQSAEDTST